MDSSFYKPSEAWNKFHEKHKLVPPPIEPNGEYYWERMVREEEEKEREKEMADTDWADFLRYSNRHNRHYEDDEYIMNVIMDGNGDMLGYQ
ncbi:MAG: hypothetical protein HOP10_09815 [Chitinophagaceae bacterium]|nr:hypothetical protein [Chitinophagaceae bacterium]